MEYVGCQRVENFQKLLTKIMLINSVFKNATLTFSSSQRVKKSLEIVTFKAFNLFG